MHNYGWGPSGALGLILVIVLILALIGRIYREPADMIVRNLLYLWMIVPVNLGAGVSLFTLVLLWTVYRNALAGR